MSQRKFLPKQDNRLDHLATIWASIFHCYTNILYTCQSVKHVTIQGTYERWTCQTRHHAHSGVAQDEVRREGGGSYNGEYFGWFPTPCQWTWWLVQSASKQLFLEAGYILNDRFSGFSRVQGQQEHWVQTEVHCAEVCACQIYVKRKHQVSRRTSLRLVFAGV